MNWGRELKRAIPGAQNFTYGEYVKSDTALRHGFINKPNEIQWQNVERNAVNIMQPVRDEFGAQRITSGFRTPDVCEKLGSSRKSTHTFGYTADFESWDGRTRLVDMVEWMWDNLEFDTIIAEYWPEGWIHASYIEGYNRRRLKLKDPDHNFDLVTIKHLIRIYG